MSSTGLTEDEQIIIVRVRMFAGGLSLVGSIFIIVSTIVSARIHRMPSRLIFWVAVMSCLESIANLMTWGIWHEVSPEVTASLICRVQGIVLQFSQISEFGWITVIALNLYLVVSLLKNTKKSSGLITCVCGDLQVYVHWYPLFMRDMGILEFGAG